MKEMEGMEKTKGSMSEIEGMEKIISRRGRRVRPYLSIRESGWATIMDGLVSALDANAYNSLDFFVKPNDKEKHIAMILHKGEKGELMLRHRQKAPHPVGCGFCLIGFVRKRPEYVGRYEVVKTKEDKGDLIVLLKPVI